LRLRCLLLAAFLVALFLLLPRELALLLLRIVLLRALLLLGFVTLRALLLLRIVPLRALLLLRIVLPSALLGALLFALCIGVVPLISAAPIIVVAIAVVVMIVVVVVLVDRDVDATRRCVETVVDVAAGVVRRALAPVRAVAVVTARWRPGRHEAPGKGDRRRDEQDRREE